MILDIGRPERRVAQATVEKRNAPYTDAVVASIIAANGEKADTDAAASGAAEIAAGVVARAFASARFEGLGDLDLHPETLADIGRDLMLLGESVLVRVTDRNGDDTLARAASWEVQGRGPTQCDWLYSLELAVPEGNRKERRNGDDVVHPRYSSDRSRPWVGVPPLQRAIRAGELAALAETALRHEATMPVGYVLPLPRDGQDTTIDALKKDIGGMKGNVAVVETTAGGWGEGKTSAPTRDWVPQRIGANPPQALMETYRAAQLTVLAALGVPVELVAVADGTGQREAWRRFLHGTLEPLARILEDQLERVVEEEVKMDFSRLFASDIAGRARAFGSLVQGGMEVPEAALQTGLFDPEA